MLYNNVKNFFLSEARKANMYAKTLEDSERLTLQISEVDLLYVAAQQLVSGHLPHFFVPHRDLDLAIRYFKRFLRINHPEFVLYREDTHFYYADVNCNAVQSNNRITIMLHVLHTACAIGT